MVHSETSAPDVVASARAEAALVAADPVDSVGSVADDLVEEVPGVHGKKPEKGKGKTENGERKNSNFEFRISKLRTQKHDKGRRRAQRG